MSKLHSDSKLEKGQAPGTEARQAADLNALNESTSQDLLSDRMTTEERGRQQVNAMTSGSITGVQENNNAPTDFTSGGAAAREEKKKKEDRFFEALHELLIRREKILEDIQKLDESISRSEQRMRQLEENLPKDEHGQIDWTKASEDLLDDKIRTRRPGESDEEYKNRIKKALKDEMLNEDGTVKDKYQGKPLAEWLQEEDKLALAKREKEKKLEELQDVDREIASKLRKIDEELLKKRDLLEKRTLENDDLLAQINKMRESKPGDIRENLRLMMQNRPDIHVTFKGNETPEQMLNKIKEGVKDNQVTVDRELVDVAVEMGEVEKTKAEVNADDQKSMTFPTQRAGVAENKENELDDLMGSGNIKASIGNQKLTSAFCAAASDAKPVVNNLEQNLQLASNTVSETIKVFNPGAVI